MRLIRSVFGGFVDNHDNPRFLNLNPSQTALKNELTFVMMGDWIPIVYYGTEQGFNGGSDPYNRESLWPYMSTEHPLYKFIQNLAKFRTSLGKDWLQRKQVRESSGPPFHGQEVLLHSALLTCITDSQGLLYWPIAVTPPICKTMLDSSLIKTGTHSAMVTKCFTRHNFVVKKTFMV